MMPPSHQLRLKQATIRETSDGGQLAYAPLIVLDCTECRGYTGFSQESATQARCGECGEMVSNERIVDLNDERL